MGPSGLDFLENRSSRLPSLFSIAAPLLTTDGERILLPLVGKEQVNINLEGFLLALELV